MNDTLATAITQAVSELFAVSVTIELSRPDEQFGDFATNVALHLSKQLGQNPRTIAESLQTELLSWSWFSQFQVD
jgi:arginyl-tRNA synthetase